MRDPSLPLPTYGTSQKDYKNRKAWLNARAQQAGYKNYEGWLTARRRAGVVPRHQGPVKLVKGVYKRQKQTRAYRQIKTKQGGKVFYYSVHSWSELTEKLKSLAKSHRTDAFMIFYRPLAKNVERQLNEKPLIGSPGLLKHIQYLKQEKTKLKKISIPLTEYTRLQSSNDVQRLITEASHRADEYTGENTPFVNDFVIVRRKL